MFARSVSLQLKPNSIADLVVLKTLVNVVEGTPQVHTYEVSNSIFHKIVARVAV